MRIWFQRLKKQGNNPNLLTNPRKAPPWFALTRTWLLSKGGNPCQFSRHRNTLTVLTLGADELFLGHGLEAETLQVEHAAALTLAGQQRLAGALADLQGAESSAGRSRAL